MVSARRVIAVGAIALFAAIGAGSASAALVNSGTSCNVSSVAGATACAGIYDGNNSNQDLDGLFGVADWDEILKLDSNGGTEMDSGITLSVNSSAMTWSIDTYAGNSPVMFVLKGGPSFSAFLMDTSVLGGAWDTLSMLKGNGKRGPNLSHWSVYSGGTAPNGVVPLPASALLLLGGIGGLGAFRTLRRKS